MHTAICKGGTERKLDLIKQGSLEVVRRLLDRETDPNAQKKSGFTPLHAAAEKGHVRVVKTLIDHGANVLLKAEVGLTPLNSAMRNVSEPNAITEMLIEAGAQLHTVDGEPGINGGTYRALASYAENRGDLAQAISLYEAATDYFDKASIATKPVK